MGIAAAGLAMIGLGGCDRAGGVLSQTLAEIKSVPVDASDHSSGTAADRKLNARDVALLVDTAKALTVGQGGVLSKSARETAREALNGAAAGEGQPDHKATDEPRLEIAVVDPLKMDRPDDGPPLDMHLKGVEMDTQAALAAARRALPDIPVTAPAPAEVAEKPRPPVDEDRPRTEMAGSDIHRSIQVGSFSTLSAAQNALEQLRDAHPVAENYKASFQKVTTGSGRALVRLRLGPVDTETQAQKLCDQLDIRDIWCHKAG
ncbi:MAG: SPOR domain-containing protein [Asticcacaulis sp.]